MEINKSALTLNGNELNISMPIAKINREARTVSGFATLDNVDTQKDRVTADASKKAFARWRGNLREMHGKDAVGKAVRFEEKTFFNPEDSKTYSGMFVTAYVSKGAPNTWEKVLDGTLTGFSIGGSVVKARDIFDKSSNSAFREVNDYEMHELSLVDNPANQLANIVSFQKSASGVMEVEGMVSDMKIETIFWCDIDKVAITTNEDSIICSTCDNEMTDIGWVEAADEDKNATVQKAIATHTSSQPNGLENATTGMQDNNIAKQVITYLQENEGGVDVSKRNKNADPSEVVEPAIEKNSTVEPANGEPESAPEVSEVQEPDFAKMFSDLRETLAGAIENSKTETEKVLGDVQASIEKSVGNIDTKVSGLETKFGELSKRVDEITEQTATVEKTVKAVVDDTAIRKSGDLGGSKDDDKLEKTSFWRGSFLSVDDIAR